MENNLLQKFIGICPPCIRSRFEKQVEAMPDETDENEELEEQHNAEKAKLAVTTKKLHKPDVDFGLGKINFSISYNIRAETLKIKLRQACDLVAMDDCGTSDPFVHFSFNPPRYEETSWETNVIKKTLYPKWKELFVFRHFPNEQLKVTTIEIAIMDWDVQGHDCLGNLIFPLKKLYAPLTRQGDSDSLAASKFASTYRTLSAQSVFDYGIYEDECASSNEHYNSSKPEPSVKDTDIATTIPLTCKETELEYTAATTPCKDADITNTQITQIANDQQKENSQNESIEESEEVADILTTLGYKRLAGLRTIKTETMISRWMKYHNTAKKCDVSLSNKINESELSTLQLPKDVETQTDNNDLPNKVRRFEGWKQLQLPVNMESNGELKIGLGYHPQQNLLVVKIYQAQNFHSSDGKSVSAYVNIMRKKIMKTYEKTLDDWVTQVRKQSSSPVWNEQISFKVCATELSTTIIDVQVIRVRNMKPNVTMGSIRLGLKARPCQKRHWTKMVSNAGMMIAEWHTVLKV